MLGDSYLCLLDYDSEIDLHMGVRPRRKCEAVLIRPSLRFTIITTGYVLILVE